ncbi:MAG: hypothetical protein ACJASX_001455 [Limisphaerales bacterium]|jgi:hypothetical protein
MFEATIIAERVGGDKGLMTKTIVPVTTLLNPAKRSARLVTFRVFALRYAFSEA